MLGKMATATKVIRRGGASELWSTGLQRLRELRRRRPGDLVRIDECVFSLAGLPIDLRYLLLAGDYETLERAALQQHLDPALDVIELGASIGVISCLTNRRLQEPARHVVVEANPTIVPRIEANRTLNGSRFRILNAALAYGCATVEFPIDENSLLSSLGRSSSRTAVVPAISLERIREEAGLDRFTLLCDIEGSEVELIESEAGCVAKHVDTMIIELHPAIRGNRPMDDLICSLLQLGFRIAHSERDVYVFKNRRFESGPEAGSRIGA